MDLFDDTPAKTNSNSNTDAPLAARMRPRTLAEMHGQSHLLGPGKPLARAIEQDDWRSAIFHGPPGCGKSTVASVIAQTTKSHFESFSAITGGVPEVRKLIAAAGDRRKAYGKRTLLFVDEIHRFNKAQQDAFLPHVEDGTIILIGATTENPYFSVIAPLLSRARVYTFQSLTEEDIAGLLNDALTDTERGLGKRNLTMTDEAQYFLAGAVAGDARTSLNTLELASFAVPDGAMLTITDIEDALGKRRVHYDKDGDAHYDFASALIKSIRGSDPDAAMYYLMRMLEAGEEPRFLARRLVVLASEDIGCADSSALPLAVACFQAVEFIGLPECVHHLAHTAIYLAAAPKSNACTMAIAKARDDVQNAAFPGVPPPLADAHYQGAKHLGKGQNYLYPHDFGGFVKQQYLPDGLPTKEKYYQPTENGIEAKIKARLENLWGEEK
jgi:putative ATPase